MRTCTAGHRSAWALVLSSSSSSSVCPLHAPWHCRLLKKTIVSVYIHLSYLPPPPSARRRQRTTCRGNAVTKHTQYLLYPYSNGKLRRHYNEYVQGTPFALEGSGLFKLAPLPFPTPHRLYFATVANLATSMSYRANLTYWIHSPRSSCATGFTSEVDSSFRSTSATPTLLPISPTN